MLPPNLTLEEAVGIIGVEGAELRRGKSRQQHEQACLLSGLLHQRLLTFNFEGEVTQCHVEGHWQGSMAVAGDVRDNHCRVFVLDRRR